MVTVLMVVAVVSAYQFFEVEGQRAMIAWACSFGLSVTGIAMFKIWYWLELAKNAVLREVKRVELRVVRLGEGK
jgi:Na+/glutamate symporter